MNIISSRDEATYRYVVEPISSTGVVADPYAEYDIDAIAAECIAWHDAYDEATDTTYLNHQGYYLIPEFGGIDPTWTEDEAAEAAQDADYGAEQFWALVERHAR